MMTYTSKNITALIEKADLQNGGFMRKMAKREKLFAFLTVVSCGHMDMRTFGIGRPGNFLVGGGIINIITPFYEIDQNGALTVLAPRFKIFFEAIAKVRCKTGFEEALEQLAKDIYVDFIIMLMLFQKEVPPEELVVREKFLELRRCLKRKYFDSPIFINEAYIISAKSPSIKVDHSLYSCDIAGFIDTLQYLYIFSDANHKHKFDSEMASIVEWRDKVREVISKQ
jgi:hypothetical protein